MKYTHLFFDLDHTLWDFDYNTAQTLIQLSEEFNLKQFSTFSEETFLKAFRSTNHQLWTMNNKGLINKEELREERFKRIFKLLQIKKMGTKEISERFINLSPTQPHCFPYTHEILEYLKSKGYSLHILTNGFSDVQEIKMRSGKILHFFESITTSDDSEARKPDPKIFNIALSKASAKIENSLMVGDGWETDIKGAQNIGMDHVFFNPLEKIAHGTPTFEIKSLIELKNFL